MISDRVAFTVFCFLLRISSAMGGAASETATMAFILKEFRENLGAVTVSDSSLPTNG